MSLCEVSSVAVMTPVKMKFKFLYVTTVILAAGFAGSPAQAADAVAAEALMRKSKCFSCHAIEKKKDGPPYREVAAKYRGKPDAEEKLIKHVTVPSKVEIDGTEEDHRILNASDPAAVKNVVQWILSL